MEERGKKMIIGSHVSFGREQLLGSVKEAISYGATTFMFYTGAPQNTMRKKIEEKYLQEADKLMEENHIDKKNVICHAPYIINLANKKDPEKWQFSIHFLKQELSRCDELGISYLVLHPGSAVGYPKEEALKNIVDALNEVLKENYRCEILLETMAGKGTECGSTLEEISYLVKNVSKEVGVCLDTCHLNDAGYRMDLFEEFLEEFEKNLTLEKIKCIHINDSKNPLSSHKDRHANIGYGTIGFENLLKICNHEKLKDVPKILETPYVGKTFEDKEKIYPPYKFEIQMIKEGKFNSDLLNSIVSYYNK